MADDAACCVVVLCGLPGSGKTTLARALLHADPGCLAAQLTLLEARGSSSEASVAPAVRLPLRVWHVCYDGVEQELLHKRTESDGQAQACSSASTDASDQDSNMQLFNVANWQKSREVALSRLQQLLEQHHGDSAARHVMLVDDNMYYRSMRYAVFKLAAQHGAGFALVHLQTPLSVCARRNAARAGSARVPSDVITTMNERFEAPDPAKFHWEANSVAVCVPSTSQPQVPAPAPAPAPAEAEAEASARVHDDAASADDAVASGAGGSATDAVLHAAALTAVGPALGEALARGWAQPARLQVVQLTPEQLAERAEERARMLESVRHNADLRLRKLVGVIMKENSGERDKARKKALGKELQSLKTRVLQELKTGGLVDAQGQGIDVLASAHAGTGRGDDGSGGSSSSSAVGTLDEALDSVEKVFRERLAVAVAKQ